MPGARRADVDPPVVTVHLRQWGRAVVMAEGGNTQRVRDEVLRWLSDGTAVRSGWWSDANARRCAVLRDVQFVPTRPESLDDERPGRRRLTARDEDRTGPDDRLGAAPAPCAVLNG